MVRWALTLEYCTLGARERVPYRKHVLLVGLGRHSRHAEAHSRSSSALVIADTRSQGAASVPEGARAAGVKAPITLMAFPKDIPKACKSAGRHTQQQLCSMTSLRAGAAGRPATWLTRSSRRSTVPTAKSTHMNCSISRVRGPLAHRHTACTVGARPESAKQHLHHAWSCCVRGQHPVLPRKID